MQPTDEQIAEVTRLYLAGYSYPRIARRTGVAAETCRQLCSGMQRTWTPDKGPSPLTREIGRCPECRRLMYKPRGGWPCKECRDEAEKAERLRRERASGG